MLTNQLKPYHMLSSITLISSRPIDELLSLLETSLNIPKFYLDESGDYEDSDVYLSYCLGFQILFAKDVVGSDQYQLAVDTARDTFSDEIDSDNLDWDNSLLALMQQACPSLEVRERRPEDDPD